MFCNQWILYFLSRLSARTLHHLVSLSRIMYHKGDIGELSADARPTLDRRIGRASADSSPMSPLWYMILLIYTDRRLALGWALHWFIWFGSCDWPLAWTRPSRHEKRPNRSKRGSRTKRTVQRSDLGMSSDWLNHVKLPPDRSNPTQK